MSFASSEEEQLLERIRSRSGIPEGRGPSDPHVIAGVRGFVQAFDYWYIRVIREAVPAYRSVIVMRINPFIRTIELEGCSADAAASKLVDDYNNRVFVTAGGWALEEMAVAVSPFAQKGSAVGIDLQWHDPETGAYHLYVLKSGLVTRNSDILKSLKDNARKAEKLLRQGRSTGRVEASYAIAAGKTSSSFEDGIRRPSSAEFWGEVMGLEPREAVELAFAIAAEAGRLVRRDASRHIQAIKLLVREYTCSSEDRSAMDWDFIRVRNMQEKELWAAEDRRRHNWALQVLASTGYNLKDPEGEAPAAQRLLGE
ncbi:MAG: PmeII family type II restriction endonuclease [Thermoanaerobaculia bacterium]